MAQEDPNRLTEWVELIRRQLPLLRQRFNDWRDAVWEEPALIWQTNAIRYATYGFGGLVVVWILAQLAGSLVPPPPQGAQEEASTADFHVVCSDPQCGQHFVIHRRFGFRRFPVECPRCRKMSGERARRCVSETCQGRWVAPTRIDRVLECPVCGRQLE